MKKTTRDTLMSVVVLTAIALVCVSLLTLANVYLRYEAVLDAATAAKINKMIPSGADDAAAFNDGYFKLYTDDELAKIGFSVKDFNKGRTANVGLVNAVYGAVKGDSAGAIVFEIAAKGYYDMTVLVAFKDKKIAGAVGKSINEDSFAGQIFSDEKFAALLDEVAGRSEVPSDDEIIAVTGATTKSSVRGLRTALAAAAEAVKLVNEDELKKLNESLASVQGGQGGETA